MIDYFDVIDRYVPNTTVPFILEIQEFARQVSEKFPGIVIETLEHKNKIKHSWEIRYRSMYMLDGGEMICKIVKNTGFMGSSEYYMIYWDTVTTQLELHPGGSFEHALAKSIASAGVGPSNAILQNMKSLERKGTHATYHANVTLSNDKDETLSCKCSYLGMHRFVDYLLRLTCRRGGRADLTFVVHSEKNNGSVPDSIDGFTKLRVNGFDFNIVEVLRYHKRQAVEDDILVPCGELIGVAKVKAEFVPRPGVVCHSHYIRKQEA